jgi:hypothetical protein
LIAALGAALLPSALRADGLPVLGIDVGSTGVASSSDGARYVTIPAGSSTIVERVAQHGGQVLAWRSLPGTFTIPAVAYDGSAGGLSADGTTLVLIQPRTSFPRAATKLVVLESVGLKPLRTVTLPGDFSFDAVSPKGSRLYLVHYVSPNDPTRYLVQAYDLLQGRLIANPITDPNEPGEKMRGNPLSRRMSADGRWAYTLYDGAGATPFVHALDTVAGSARCIDLDAIASATNLWRLRLGLDRDGRHLVVRRSGVPLLLVDVRTFAVANAADAHAQRGWHSPMHVFLAAGVLALVAAAAGVLWTRRRRRRTLIPGLGQYPSWRRSGKSTSRPAAAQEDL